MGQAHRRIHPPRKERALVDARLPRRTRAHRRNILRHPLVHQGWRTDEAGSV